MTKEDVRKVVDALKERGLGIIDLGIPTYSAVAKETGTKEISLNIWNNFAVIELICGELHID